MGSKTVVRRVARERQQVMGAKTVKRLAILVVVLASLIAGGYFLRQLQVGRMAQGVLARADQAAQKADFAGAAELYLQHLTVVPNDQEVRLNYADVIVKADRSQKRLQEALQIYEDIIRQYPGRMDVRRRAAELAFEMGRYETARIHLAVLLKGAKDDGHLEYLMGRCDEYVKEFESAEKSYKSAIEHGAPERDRLDASYRLAVLLRDKLGQPEEADKVIGAMVESAPKDYQVYLGRGKYREQFRIPGGEDDFSKALQLAPDKPEVYLAAAGAAERQSKDKARQVLDQGLEAAPKAVELYQALFQLEMRAGRPDQATKVLEHGLDVMPDEVELRVPLALLLAERGDTGHLALRVDELERMDGGRASTPFTRYLRAFIHFNGREFLKARQILVPLLPDVAANPDLKVRANLLLSRCHAELNEPEQARDALLRVLHVDPKNMAARLGLIQGLIDRGEWDEAVGEYRGLLSDQAGADRLRLAALLIEQNRQLPPAQRQLDEAERLIDQAVAASPGDAQPVIWRARLLMEQGHEAKAIDVLEAARASFPKDAAPWIAEADMLIRQKKIDKAIDVLETARARFPKDAAPWIAEADMLIRQKKIDEAQGVLDKARPQFGDRADLRLARVRLVVARGGPQAIPALNELAQGIETFARPDRTKLLTAVALELVRQQDLAGAARAWSRLVELEPENLQPRLRLFDLALQSQDREHAEGQIRAIAKLDEYAGQFCQAQLLMQQAQGAAAADKEKKRGMARGLLTELKSRRPDWSRVPLALARLNELELEEEGLDEAQKREKLEAAITAYRRAIELGLRDPALVRYVVRLLFRAGRGSEALEVYSQLPTSTQRTGDLWRMALEIARANRDFVRAEEIVRKEVEANPQDLQVRVLLAQVLLEGRHPDEAEAEIRKAVDAAKTDPQRWLTLVRFELQTRQTGKAEKAVRDAEANLAQAPLDLAQCCQEVGNAYAAADPDRAKSWYGQARGWLAKAQEALKDPGDLTVKRRSVEFLLQTNQAAEAEGPLKEILARAADGKSPELDAWARRGLARVYTAATPPRTDEALALFPGKEGPGGAEADDLRVRSLIHEAQGTPEGRLQAIADLQVLVGRESAAPEDRRRLAQLLEAAGEWPRAREQFRELIRQTEGARDIETLNRRPLYFDLFVNALIRHHQSGDDSDLAEARQLVGKFQSIQDNPMGVALLEAQIDKAANQLDAANARIRDFAAQPNLTVMGRLRLAAAAERIGLIGAAESIFRGVAARPPADPNQFALILFLARHGHIQEAVDLCETLRADPAIRDQATRLGGQIVADPSLPLDEVQTKRVLGWLVEAVTEKPQSLLDWVMLGNLYERLRDYSKAEESYRAAIKINDGEGIASNNLAWLISLKGGQGKEALELINNAIHARGPVPEFLDTRGMVYLAVGEKKRAIADLENAIKAAPNGSKCFHLAQAYLQVNEPEKARRVLEAGKTRGLPGGLHPLEMPAYDQVASKLGKP